MTTRERPQTAMGLTYHKQQRRAWFASMIGFGLAVWPAVILTDGLPIEQRLLWIGGAVLLVTAIFGSIFESNSGEPLSRNSLLAAEKAVAEMVGEPAVIVAILKAPDLEQTLAAAQNVSTLTVPPAAILAVGPKGLCVGPSRPGRGVMQFIDRHRVLDAAVGETPTYQEWPPIDVAVLSHRGVVGSLQFFPTTRAPLRLFEPRSLRTPEADEREVKGIVALMRDALGLDT